MKKEIVKLETAILAKEKGFDYLCLAFYDDDELDNQDGNTLTDYNSDYWNRKNNHKHDILENKWFSAPTQSLLQKWLREEHDISIVVIANSKKQFFVDYRYFDQCVDDDSELVLLHGRIFNSYEEALEKGLYEALKLI